MNILSFDDLYASMPPIDTMNRLQANHFPLNPLQCNVFSLFCHLSVCCTLLFSANGHMYFAPVMIPLLAGVEQPWLRLSIPRTTSFTKIIIGLGTYYVLTDKCGLFVNKTMSFHFRFLCVYFRLDGWDWDLGPVRWDLEMMSWFKNKKDDVNAPLEQLEAAILVTWWLSTNQKPTWKVG